MAIKVISTNGGTDFSSVIPAILINGDGDYVAISGTTGTGLGDVTGPGSSTPNAVALYSGGSGKIIKDSSLTYNGGILSFAGSPVINAAGGGILLNAGAGNIQETATGIVQLTAGDTAGITAESGVSITSNSYVNIGAADNITLTSTNNRVELISYADKVNIDGNTDVNILAETGDVTITAPAGNVIISGLSLLNQIQVGNGGGFVSSAAGQEINLSASSGVSIGGGSGPISLGTINSQVNMNTGDGAGGTGVFSAYPTSATMQVTEGGNEQYISILTPANNIWTKGNFRPETSGTNSIGLVTAPYSGVVALNVITQSPNGAFWRLAVSNAGVISGVSYP